MQTTRVSRVHVQVIVVNKYFAVSQCAHAWQIENLAETNFVEIFGRAKQILSVQCVRTLYKQVSLWRSICPLLFFVCVFVRVFRSWRSALVLFNADGQLLVRGIYLLSRWFLTPFPNRLVGKEERPAAENLRVLNDFEELWKQESTYPWKVDKNEFGVIFREQDNIGLFRHTLLKRYWIWR